MLSTALFYLSQKSDKFDGVIGKSAYGVSKLYHANNKLLLFFESLAAEDLKESITAVLKSDTTKECGNIGGFPLWKDKDNDCTPDYRSLIEIDFNNRFKDKLSLLDQDRLFSYRSSYGFTESFSKLGWDVFTKKWSSEVFVLVKSKDSPDNIKFAVVPDKDQESVHIIGDDVWVLDMGDANTGLLIARVEQIPSFRINTDFRIYGLLTIQSLPENIITNCKDSSDAQLKSCVDKVVKPLKEEAIVTDIISLTKGRDVKVQMTIKRGLKEVTLRFAVRIPAQGLFVFKDITITQSGKDLQQAFSLDKKDPLTIKATLQIPSLQGLNVRLCTQSEEDAPIICPPNEFIFEDGKQMNVESLVAEDQKSIKIIHNWDKFPKGDFNLWLEAQREEVTIKSDIIKVFNNLK